MKQLRNKDGQTLEEFLAAYQPGDYPHPSVTVDLLVVSLEKETPELLMIRRGNHPWLGCWALPGGFVEKDEFTEDSAARELEEETGATGLALSEVGLFSGPDRDPRGWTMSYAYTALTRRSELPVQGGDDADDADWFALRYRMNENIMLIELVNGDERLAASVTFECRDGALGREYRVGKFEADGIAFDHSKMIALAILKLRDAGKL